MYFYIFFQGMRSVPQPVMQEKGLAFDFIGYLCDVMLCLTYMCSFFFYVGCIKAWVSSVIDHHGPHTDAD